MFVDGIIRRERDQSIISEGSKLYKTLNENNRVVLVTKDAERTEIWLKMHNLGTKLDDIQEIVDTPLPEPELMTVEVIRSQGKIDYVITDNSVLAKRLLESGFQVLVFLNPRYARPEFRPDGREGKKSWEEITEEIDKQQGLYSEDTRI
jgi:hypothetical protein